MMNRCLLTLMVALLTAGCANVSPTARGTLAKPEMRFDADPGLVKLKEQSYASKEGAAGGRGTGGGGCGCT